MKQFIVDRHTTPNTPKMDEVPNEKIPIYDSLADAEADLSNLTENQIVATKDEGVSELLHTVDTVEAGVMNPVTSNAVAEALTESFGEWVDVYGSGAIKGLETKNGKYLAVRIHGTQSTYGQVIGWLTDSKWYPTTPLYIICVNTAFLVIGTNGSITAYSTQGGSVDLYCDTIALLI